MRNPTTYPTATLKSRILLHPLPLLQKRAALLLEAAPVVPAISPGWDESVSKSERKCKYMQARLFPDGDLDTSTGACSSPDSPFSSPPNSQSRLEATGSLCPGASTARCAKRLEEILFSVHMKNNQKNGGSTPPSIDEYYAGSMRGRIKPLLVVLLERKLRTHKQELIQSSKSHHAQEATR